MCIRDRYELILNRMSVSIKHTKPLRRDKRMSNQKTGFLPMWKKIAYGSGNAGGGFIWGMVTTFLLIYCTNVIGVSAAIIGTLLMIAKVFDGITDIFMGRIIDRTNSKMGKSRFWYLISCAPVSYTHQMCIRDRY